MAPLLSAVFSAVTVSSSATTIAPTTAKPNLVADCLGGWDLATECCCQTCPSLTGGPGFGILTMDDCTLTGGQCKEYDEVFCPKDGTCTPVYVRPQPAALAHRSLRLRSAAGGTEQHHVIGGEPDEVTIVFMEQAQGPKTTMDVTIRVKDDPAQSTTQSTVTSSYSFFENPQGYNGYTDSNRGHEYFDCEKKENGHPHYQNATCFYTSDTIHQTQVTGLMAKTKYEYLVVGEDTWREFRTPPAVGSPISIGAVADLGQTTDAILTMQHMKTAFDDGELDMIVFPGDLSYADGYAPAWDSYGRVSEFLFSAVPTSYGVGNHESTSGLENNVNFIPRYGWQSTKSTSSSNLWFSYEAGYAHVIMLCSYCDTREGSTQYVWLQRDLEAVDRTRTPWVVMSWHIPFYTSSLHHPMENQETSPADGAQQRADMEDLINQHGVDFTIQGHVHSYERTDPVFKNETACNGTVYVTIGDGGNHEGPACGWVQNLPWSAKKETSFGFGVLNIFNETDAEWVWHRNQDGVKEVADRTFVKSTATRCNTVAAPPPVTAFTV